MKKLKRAFTIVELVIVIAVIAILAAVLIPTFSNIIRKANISSDTQLVRNLNTALVVDRALKGEHKTMHSALQAAFDAGYDIDKINARANQNEILWDSVNDVFCYYDVDQGIIYTPDVVNRNTDVKNYQYWKIVNTTEAVFQATADGYSIYAGSNFKAKTIKLDRIGFDAGNNETITSIEYTNESNEARDVVIRTKGGSLDINDSSTKSTQTHYGTSASVTVAASSYTCHSVVGAMSITSGSVTADSGAYIGVIEADDNVDLIEVNGGVFVIPSNADASKIDENVAAQIGYEIEGSSITATEEKQAKTYFYIDSEEKLYAFVDAINSGVEIPFAKFTENITLDVSEKEWDPIGNWQYPYHGTIDGMGCTIIGLTQTANATKSIWSTGNSTGLGAVFGFIGIAGGGDVTIMNINFTDVNISISAQGKNVGTIIGYVPENKDFYSPDKGGAYWTQNENDVTGEKRLVTNEMGKGNVTLINVTTSGNVEGKSHVSGMIGKIYTAGNIRLEGCTNSCNVTGESGYLGGLIGIQSGDCKLLEVINCTNEGIIKLTTTANGVAGLIGRANNEATHNSLVVVLQNCSNSGEISYPAGAPYNDLVIAHDVKSVTIK